MDKRLKSLMVDAIVDKAVDQNPLVDRIKAFLSEADENAFLYLGGFVTLPEIGSTFVMRKGGEDVECVVKDINITNGTITLTHPEIRTYYFKTAEAANNFTTTGRKGNYPNWDDEPSEEYCHKGEYEFQTQELIGFYEL